MFSGIVETVRKIIKINSSSLTIENNLYNDLTLGESISVNGACLTVVKFDRKKILFDISNETLSVTNFRFLKTDDYVNIERAARFGDRIGGHYVTGHVDEIAYVDSINKLDRFFVFKFRVNSNRYLVEKGSVAVNGVSLTAFDIRKNLFSVSVIPHTYENTNFKFLKVGSAVNIEYDILIKSIINSNNPDKNSKLTWEFLRDNGFI